MVSDDEWAERVKRLFKAELKRKGVSYKELAEKLGELGIADTEANIKNKMSRGGFSAVYLIQCLTAIGCRSLELRED